MTKFRKDLEVIINQNSKENGSNTPDFILADYLADCLDAFDKAVTRRSGHLNKGRRPIENVYGDMKPGTLTNL